MCVSMCLSQQTKVIKQSRWRDTYRRACFVCSKQSIAPQQTFPSSCYASFPRLSWQICISLTVMSCIRGLQYGADTCCRWAIYKNPWQIHVVRRKQCMFYSSMQQGRLLEERGYKQQQHSNVSDTHKCTSWIWKYKQHPLDLQCLTCLLGLVDWEVKKSRSWKLCIRVYEHLPLMLPNLVQCRFSDFPPCPDFWMLTEGTQQFCRYV